MRVGQEQPDRGPDRPAHATREIDEARGEHAQADALENAGDAVVLSVEGEKPDEIQTEAQRDQDGGPQDGLTRRSRREAPEARRSPKESAIDTPTRKRKNGKFVSVYVQPCHSAWRSCG